MRFGILTLASVLLAACGGGLGPGTLQEHLDEGAAYLNRDGTRLFASVHGGALGGTKVSARVDNGDTIVMMLKNTPTGNATFNPNVVRKGMREDLCGDSVLRELIAMGGKVRVEITSNTGFKVPPVQIANC